MHRAFSASLKVTTSLLFWPSYISNTFFLTAQWNQLHSREKTTSLTANYTINCLSDPIWYCSKWSKVFACACVCVACVCFCLPECLRPNAVCCSCHPQSVELKHLIAQLPLVCLPKHSFCLPNQELARAQLDVARYAPRLSGGSARMCHTNRHVPPVYSPGKILKEERHSPSALMGGEANEEDHFVLLLLSLVNVLTHLLINRRH